MVIEDPSWPRADEWLQTAADEPALAVVGVPTAVASLSPSQAHLTPARLRAVLGRFSTYHSERGVDVSSLSVADWGDWDLAHLDVPASQAAILAHAAALPAGPTYAFLGGDDAITRPLVLGLAGDDLEAVGVLTLDAHHDVRTLENGPNNGTPLRGLVEDGLPGDHVAQVGIHSFANSAPYRAWCEEQGFAVFTMATVDDWGIEETVGVALDHLRRRCERIYVDVDLDVLDRAFAPACPGARPGGMTPRQLATAAWLCGRASQVTAAGFVEVDAAADVGDATLLNLATALLSFAAGVAARRLPGAGT